MFAILLSSSMDPFYRTLASFPTAIFTFVLLLCVLFWLAAVLGVIDIDFLDVDLPTADADLAGQSGDLGNPNALAGLLLRFGLSGVPVMVVLTLVALVGWLLSYYAAYLLDLPNAGALMRYGAGSLVLIIATYLAALVTALLIRPLRPLFERAQQGTPRQLLGQHAVVRTSVVNDSFGEAVVEDGGAGLILKVRSAGEAFRQGDRVVLLEYLAQENAYRVISEREFMN